MQPLPPVKKPKQGVHLGYIPLIGLILGSILLGSLLGFVIGRSGSSTGTAQTAITTPTSNGQSATPTAVATIAPTPTPVATTAATPAATTASTTGGPWTTTQSFSGTDAGKTQKFTVGSSWKLVWSCDLASAGGYGYNVIIHVYDNQDNWITNAGVNEICQQGKTGGEVLENQAGTFYLDVLCVSAWKVLIQEMK
jgi:hypothetical protein